MPSRTVLELIAGFVSTDHANQAEFRTWHSTYPDQSVKIAIYTIFDHLVNLILGFSMGAPLVKTPGRQKAAIREINERAILAAAEEVFAEFGYAGATTSRIAEIAGIPKANLHYYFPTKESLYRRVIDNIFTIWLEAAGSFDRCDDPVEALTQYIHTKMEISQTHPLGSKVWANEIIQRAPVIQDYLETTLREWTASRAAAIEHWIEEGKLARVDPYFLLYMIWATTQHYADFSHQITTLNAGNALSDEEWDRAKTTVTDIILRGIGAIP